MLPAEAKWIGKALSSLSADQISPCLNLGSSTGEFRTLLQRHINDYLIAPNEARGVRFIHADIKKEPGVDIAGDIFDPEYRVTLTAMKPACVLCCNMFEHVSNRPLLAQICQQIVRPGGHLIFSVPYSFPYHVDPIDTYFRPTPAELASLFPDCEVVASDIVSDETYWDELKRQSVTKRLLTIFKVLLHIPLPFFRWKIWKGKVHRLFWLFRPYRVSVVVLRHQENVRLPRASERPDECL